MVVRLSVHQPCFLPWAGYWNKLLNSDVHVVLTGVAFDRAGFQHRVPLNGSWLTVPVKHGACPLLKNVEIDRRALKKVANRLRQSFPKKTTLCWARVDDLADCIEDAPQCLSELNIQLMQLVIDTLGYAGPRIIIDDTPSDMSLSKTQRLFSRFASYGLGSQPVAYLSGLGGLGYTDPAEVPEHVTFMAQHMKEGLSGDTAVQVLARNVYAGQELETCGSFEEYRP